MLAQRFVIASSFLGLASLASAGIIYSTDGTATPGFTTSSFLAAVNGGEGFKVGFAVSFTAQSTGQLASLTVAGTENSPSPFTETFSILADSAGVPGTTILDTIFIDAPENYPSGQLVTGFSTDTPLLVAGQSYWLEAAPPAAFGEFPWFFASPNVSADVYISENGGAWASQGNQSPAFSLQTAVSADAPEPASWLLCLAAPVLLLRRASGSLTEPRP